MITKIIKWTRERFGEIAYFFKNMFRLFGTTNHYTKSQQLTTPTHRLFKNGLSSKPKYDPKLRDKIKQLAKERKKPETKSCIESESWGGHPNHGDWKRYKSALITILVKNVMTSVRMS